MMRKYYVEYLNENGMDREVTILADNPQTARHKFDMEFGMSEICGFYDTTDGDDNWLNVLMEIYDRA